MQYYDISIAPNTSRQINVPGRFVYFLSGSAGGADNTILMRKISGSEAIPLKPGQAFRLAAGDTNKDWVITNYANQGTIIGMLLIGDGEFLDNRITGSVEVIDGGKARTLANTAFLGLGYQAASAGNYSHVQLWNPPGSGKNIFLNQITVTSSAAITNINIYSTNAALSALFGNPQAKKNGGIASVMESRKGAYAAPQGTAFGVLDPTMKNYKFTEPVVIPPGYGVNLSTAPVNTEISSMFEYYEEGV